MENNNENTIIGDGELANIAGVHQGTIQRWRKRGWITGRPMGIRKNGRPAMFYYDRDKVLKEIQENINLKKVQEKIQ